MVLPIFNYMLVLNSTNFASFFSPFFVLLRSKIESLRSLTFHLYFAGWDRGRFLRGATESETD